MTDNTEVEEIKEFKRWLATVPSYSVPEFIAAFPKGYEPHGDRIRTFTVYGFLLSISISGPLLTEEEIAHLERIHRDFPPPWYDGRPISSDRSFHREDFIVSALPAPDEDFHWPLFLPERAVNVDHRFSLDYDLTKQGIPPNNNSDLKYALPVRITGSLRPTEWGTAGLYDVLRVFVPAHERQGVQIPAADCLYYPW